MFVSMQSDTCGVRIPELDLELVEGTLGGRFTTVEGLLQNIIDQLSDQANPNMLGLFTSGVSHLIKVNGTAGVCCCRNGR